MSAGPVAARGRAEAIEIFYGVGLRTNRGCSGGL